MQRAAVTVREYLIDASACWRIDPGAVLPAAWRDHLERGLAWVCPPAEMEICRRGSPHGPAHRRYCPRLRLHRADDGDYAHQIAAVGPGMSARMVGDGSDRLVV